MPGLVADHNIASFQISFLDSDGSGKVIYQHGSNGVFADDEIMDLSLGRLQLRSKTATPNSTNRSKFRRQSFGRYQNAANFSVFENGYVASLRDGVALANLRKIIKKSGN